jgi:uncharacterized protein YeaO (DUF488 family)
MWIEALNEMIKLKRAYEAAGRSDGYRVLIDRLWPRGVKKADLELDEWARELAPSTELRKRFGHDPAKWKEFSASYRLELRRKEAREKMEELARRARKGTVTLVYAARDEEHNDAVVLKKVIDQALKKRASRKAA